MATFYGFNDPNAYEFLSNGQFDWFDGGIKKYKELTGIQDFNKYQEARFRKYNQDIAAANGIVDHNINNVVKAFNKNTVYSAIQDFEDTYSIAQGLANLTHYGTEGTVFAFDTETLGFDGDLMDSKYGAVTEVGYASVKYRNGMPIGGISNNTLNTQKRTAVFGVDDSQTEALRELFKKSKEQGLESLTGTEVSTIERVTKYRDIDINKLGISSINNKQLLLLNTAEAEAMPHSQAAFEKGLNVLNSIYHKYSNQEESYNALRSYISGTLTSGNVYGVAKNKMFDLTALNFGEQEALSTLDIQTPLKIVSSYLGLSEGATIADINGTSNISGASLSSLVEALGLNQGFSDVAHIAGEDSLETILTPMSTNFYNNQSMVETALDMFESVKEANQNGLSDISDLNNRYIYIRRNGNNHKTDVITRTIDGSEQYLAGFNPANQFWSFDEGTSGRVTIPALMEGDKELRPKAEGIMLSFVSADDDSIKLHKFFDTEKDAGVFLRYSTNVLDSNSVTQAQIQEQAEFAYKEQARRHISRLISTNDAGRDSKGLVNGEADLEKYISTYKSIIEQYPETNFASRDWYKNPGIQEILSNTKDGQIINPNNATIKTNRYNDVVEFGYMADYLSQMTDITEDVSSAIGNKKLTNYERTSILQSGLSSLESKLASDKWVINPQETPLTTQDLLAVTLRTPKDTLTDIDFSVSNNQVASSLNSRFRAKTQGETVKNLLDASEDLFSRHLLTYEQYNNLLKRYPMKDNSFAVAQDIAASVKENISFIEGMNMGTYRSLEHYNELIENGILSFEDIQHEGFNYSRQQLKIIGNKNIRPIYENVNNTLNPEYINLETKEVKGIGELYPRYREQVKQDIASAIANKDVFISDNGFKFNDVLKKPISVNDQQLSTYKDLFEYLGYDITSASHLSKGEFVSDTNVGSFIESTIGHNSYNNVAYSIASRKAHDTSGIRYGVTGNEQGAYIFMTNKSDIASVADAISSMGENYTESDIRNALKNKAAVISFPKIKTRVAGTKDSGVSDAVLDLIGTKDNDKLNILLQSFSSGNSNFETFSSKGLNAYTTKDGKINISINDMYEDAVSSYRRNGPFTIESVTNRDYAKAQRQIDRFRNAVKQEAPMGNSYIYNKESGEKYMQISLRDISRAYEFRLGNPEEMTGIMSILQEMAYGNPEAGTANYNPNYNKDIAGMFALFNSSTVIDGNKHIVYNTSRDKFAPSGAKIQDFTKEDIRKIVNNEKFREFYAKSLYTNGTSESSIPGFKTGIYGYGQQPLIKDAIARQDSRVLEAIQTYGLNPNELENTSILGLVNNAVQSNENISPESKKAFSRLWNARDSISNIMPISSARKGNIMLLNIPEMAQMGYHSSSIRPTAISMFDAYRYSPEQFAQDVNRTFGFKQAGGKRFNAWEALGIRTTAGTSTELAYNMNSLITGDNGYANKNVPNLAAYKSTFNMFYKAMDQSQINSLIEPENLEVAKRIALRSFKDRTGIKYSSNPNYAKASEIVLKDLVSMAQMNEGKNIISPELASNPFFYGAEAEKVTSTGLQNLFENGSERDIEATKNILMGLRGRTVNKGDIIGYDNGRSIRYTGPKAVFDTNIIESFMENGESYVAGEMTAVNSAKLNINQEKNTTIGINVNNYSHMDDILALGLNEEEAKAMIASSWNGFVGYDNKNPYAVRANAVMNGDFIKHNIALPAESQWSLITRVYSDAGKSEDLIRDISNSKYSNIIKDWNLKLRPDGTITYNFDSSKGALSEIDSLMKGFYDGSIGANTIIDGQSAADIISNINSFMTSNGIGLSDVSRVNMRQATAKHFTWDPRMEEAMKRKAYNLEDFISDGTSLSNTIYSEFIETQKERMRSGEFNTKFGAGLDYYNGNIDRESMSRFFSTHQPYRYQENENLIGGIAESINFYNNPESEAFKNGAQVVRLKASEILSSIPETGADAAAYNEYIARIDHELPEFIKRRIGNIPESQVNSFILELDNEITINNKKVNEIMMPIFNISTNGIDNELYQTDMIRRQTNLFNSLIKYNKSDGTHILDKETGRYMAPSDWISNEVSKYYSGLGAELKILDKDSLAGKLVGRYKAPNGSESLAAENVVPSLRKSIAPKVKDLEFALSEKAYTQNISLSDMEQLAQLYKAYSKESVDFADKIASGESIVNDLTSSEKWFKERYGKHVIFDKAGKIQNSVEAGKEVFENSGLDLYVISQQLLEDASYNKGKLTKFEDQSRFGGTFALGQTVGEVGSSKTKIGTVDAYLHRWRGVVKGRLRQTAFTFSDESNELVENLIDQFEENILLAERDKENMFNATRGEIDRLLKILSRNNVLTAEERVQAQNTIRAAGEEALNSLSEQYLKHVGLYGITTRYPIFSNSSMMMSRIYLGDDLSNSIRYFGPQYPKLLHVDFDADDVFTQFMSNVGLYDKSDKLYSLAGQIYEKDLDMNVKALEDFFRSEGSSFSSKINGYKYNINPNSPNMLLMSRLVEYGERFDTVKSDLDNAIKSFESSLGEDKIKAFREAFGDEADKAINFAFMFSDQGLEVMSKYDVSILNSVDNMIASAKAEVTKGQIGYISNPNRDINLVVSRLLDTPGQNIEEIKDIARNLDVVGVNYDGKFGPYGILDVTEQMGIDVKKIFEGEEASTSSEFRTAISSLMASREPLTKYNTSVSKEVMDKRTLDSLKGLVKITRNSVFKDVDNFDINNYAEDIYKSTRKQLKERLLDATTTSERAELVGKIQVRSLMDLAYIKEARDTFFDPIINAGNLNNQKLNQIVQNAYRNGDIKEGTDALSVLNDVINRHLVPDEKLLMEKNMLYASRLTAEDPSIRVFKLDNILTEDDALAGISITDISSRKSQEIKGTSFREINQELNKLFDFSDETMRLSIRNYESSHGEQLLSELKMDAAQQYTGGMMLEATLNNIDLANLEKQPGMSQDVRYWLGALSGGLEEGGVSKVKETQERLVAQLNTIERLRLEGADVSSKELLTYINQHYQGRRVHQIDEVVNMYTASKGIQEFNKLVDKTISNNQMNYFSLNQAVDNISSKYINTALIEEELEASIAETEKALANMPDDVVETVAQQVELVKKQTESEILTQDVSNTMLANEEMMKFFNSWLSREQEVQDMFNWTGLFKDGKLIEGQDIDFKNIKVGYGVLANKSYGELTKDDIKILKKTFRIHSITNTETEQAYSMAKQLADLYQSKNLDLVNTKMSENIIGQENAQENISVIKNIFKKISDNLDNLDEKINSQEVEELAGSVIKNGVDRERKTISGSILKGLKNIPKEHPNLKRNSLIALGVLAGTSIIGHVAHSKKTGDPLTPHSTKLSGKNPYTGDPYGYEQDETDLVQEEMAEERKSHKSKTKDEHDSNKHPEHHEHHKSNKPHESNKHHESHSHSNAKHGHKNNTSSAPSSLREKHIYVDNDTGLKFKVNARTSALLDYRQTHNIAMSQGINSGNFNISQDNSRIDNIWLQNKFAQYL